LTEARSSLFHSTFCALAGGLWQLNTCRASRTTILLAFDYTVSKLESTIGALYVIANTIEFELDELESHLRVIRDLLAEEAGAVASARDDLIGDPWYWFGFHRRELLRHNTRFQAVHSIMAFSNTASRHVAGVRSRLRSVDQELKVLKELASEPERAQEVISLKGFTHSLHVGVLRLREAQVATLFGQMGEDSPSKPGSKTQAISQ